MASSSLDHRSMSERYEIREQIGKGGLGAVYKAFDTQLQREVAMKRVLTTEHASEDEVDDAAKKLIAEAQTLSSLNHPNIITVFDVGQDTEGGFVVMELLKGETLDDTVERGVLTQEDFTEVVYQTMEALIAAQAQNVIHRDIKPTNIMVVWQASGKFQTKILDFGLAKFSKSPTVQTMDQEDSVMGSIFFMAPEQFERGELDARTDLYQMGCVYYHALTGQYPFNGETAPQVMNAHLQHKVIPLEQIRPDLSPSICQWVMWLINRDIDHRPADAREALTHWPRNPEPPGAQLAEVLPVEETPEVSSGQVRIVTNAHQAEAPPALIVKRATGQQTGATTGKMITGAAAAKAATGPNPPVGSKSQRLQAGSKSQRLSSGSRSQRITAGGPATGSVAGAGGGDRKKLWIALAAAGAAIAVFAGMMVMNKARSESRNERLADLARAEAPAGTVADVQLCLSFLENPNVTVTQKDSATRVLSRLTGTGIDERITSSLSGSDNAATRVRLAQVLANRGYGGGVPVMMKAFDTATTVEQRIAILDAVRAVAGPDHLQAILESLRGDHPIEVRRVFEDTVVTMLRQSPNRAPQLDQILARLDSSSGSERKSLFRILGSLGGAKVRTHLVEVYQGETDVDYQRDAMIAFLSWPKRNIRGPIKNVIENTNDRALRSAAEKALVRLASLPGPEPVQERVQIWRDTYRLLSNPNDFRRLIDSLIEYPSPATLALLREWSKDPKYGAFASAAADSLEQIIAGAPTVQPGGSLPGNKARIGGERDAAFDRETKAITNWTSPDTWFSWHFQVPAPGDYGVTVLQSQEADTSSQFLVYLADTTLEGESKPTGSRANFEPVRLPGTITLEAGRIYSLFLVAGESIQPRMMDVSAVRIVKP